MGYFTMWYGQLATLTGLFLHFCSWLTHTTRGHWFYWAKLCLFYQNSNISQVISGITKPILGMLVLIWMHFSRWFRIWYWNSTILTFCRLHLPAAWLGLNMHFSQPASQARTAVFKNSNINSSCLPCYINSDLKIDSHAPPTLDLSIPLHCITLWAEGFR